MITDDQGYGDLSCHGNPILKTPNLDRLHSQSVRFLDYHVAPTCSPTRAALQSGHWTNRTGVWHTILGRSMLRENEPTLGQVFQDSGYATGMFGKWHLGDNVPFRPEDRGYQEVMRHGGGGVGQTPDYWDNAYFDGAYWHNGTPKKVNGYCTDVFFEYAKQFVLTQKSKNKPFFAYISTNAPHGPFHSPEKYVAPYRELALSGMKPQGLLRLKHFFGMIANIDDNVGKFRQFLESEGLAENTIFIFTTDNGTSTGANIFNASMRGRKGSPYDGGHRVPLFVHWPAGNLTSGKDIRPICHAVDILPTLVEMAGLESPKGFNPDGKSLVPLLNGQTNDSWDQRILVTDSQRVKDPIKWKSSSVMTSRWRLINGTQLYDIDKDPGQKKDIAKGHPDTVKRLRDFYENWWQELEPTFKIDAPIQLGHPQENPARLTSHDWITNGSTPWNQQHIRRGADSPNVTGYWNVEVVQAGEYEVRLRRWPVEANAPINAGLPAGQPVPGSRAFRTQPGKEFGNLDSASVKIWGQTTTVKFEKDAKEAVLNLKLPAGKTRLYTKFHGPEDYSVGAYYAYIKRLQ